MIARFEHNGGATRRWSATGLALSLALVAVALTGAVRGDDKEEETGGAAAQTAGAAPSAGAAQSAGTAAPAPAVSAASAPATSAASASVSAGGGTAGPFTQKDEEKLWRDKYADRVIMVNGREVNREQVDREFLAELQERRAASSSSAQRAPARAQDRAAEPEGERAEDRATEAQLARPLPELNFDAVAFAEVIDFLRDVSGANVFVEWKALEAAGVERSTPVTVRVRNVKFSDALNMVLRSAGQGVPLGYMLKGGVLRISTLEDLDRETEIRAYDVRDIVPAEMEMQKLAELIRESVAPDSWRDAGGSSSALHTSKHKMIVTTTEPNHRQIRAILQMLREHPEQGPRTENAATAAQAPPAGPRQ